MQSENSWQNVGKFAAFILAAIAFIGSIWLAVNTHTRDIENLRAADIEIRAELKELRKEQTEMARQVASGLSDIKVQMKEIVTVLRLQDDRAARGVK